MQIRVLFHSYFKELAGRGDMPVEIAGGSTLGELVAIVLARCPRLAPMKSSMLMAVGVEYQKADYRLCEGDEVSLFPPVQGG
ncbi:MAG: MoaD/ThiS family protein [Verrucomicrobiota bacterium]